MESLEMTPEQMLDAIACSYSSIKGLYEIGLATEEDVKESFDRLQEAMKFFNFGKLD